MKEEKKFKVEVWRYGIKQEDFPAEMTQEEIDKWQDTGDVWVAKIDNNGQPILPFEANHTEE